MLGIDYLFDEPLSLFVVVWSGIVTADDWRQHIERQIADPLFVGAERWLTDVRRAEADPSIDASVVEEISEQLVSTALSLGVRTFAAIDPWRRWQALAFERLLSGQGVKADVCPDVGSALDWIGIPYEDRPEVERMLDSFAGSGSGAGGSGADPGN